MDGLEVGVKRPATKRGAVGKPVKPIIILSAGAKGGPGKSFIVKNLAPLAAKSGRNIAVVDFDNQRTLTKWLGRRAKFYPEGPIITGYEASPDEPKDARDVIALTGHDIIFIDTPPSIDRHPEVLKTLAIASSLVIVPIRVSISDTESAEVLLVALQQWGVPVLAVLNQVKPRSTKQLSVARKRLLRLADLSVVSIMDYADYWTADEVGRGATEMRNCLGSDLIDDAWADVCRRIKIGA